MTITSHILPKRQSGSWPHPSTITARILPKSLPSPHASYKSRTTSHPLKLIGWLMWPTKKTTSPKISTSSLNPSKLSISERKVPSICGFGSASSPLLSSPANSSSKAGSTKTTTDSKDHHHSCTPMKTILMILKTSSSSKPQNTTNGGTQVFSRDRNFLPYFRYMKIQDGKKIYFKHAGVNQPSEIPEFD
jgi:hypothetical protein